MKKYMLLALSALALASCSNDEVVVNNPANAISFSVTAPKGSRANTTFTGKFKVYAYQAGTEGAYINGAFYNTANANPWTVKDGETESNVNFYWPETTAEKALNFYAVAPETVAAFNGKAITNYTASGSEDLCYAVTTGAQKPTTTGTQTNLNFRHALSQVKFQLQNTADTDIEVTVADVQLQEISSKATLTLPEANTKALTANYDDDANIFGLWNFPTEQVYTNYNVATSVTAKLTNDATGVGAPLYLLPQTIKSWDPTKATEKGVRVAVTCTVKSLANNQEVWTNKTVYIPLPAITWQQHKIYTYTLKFGNGAGFDDNGNPVLVKVDIKATVDGFVEGSNFEVAPN